MKVEKKILIIVLVIILIALVSGIIYVKRNPTIAVVCYHNIATAEEKEKFPDEKDWIITVDNFEEHLKYLKNHGYKTLTTEEFYNWKQGKIDLPYKSILITFDDGFLSNAHYAFPLLKKYNMNATVFVIGEFIDNSKETGWTGNVKTYMSKEVLEKVKEEYPNIEICSHSYGLHKDGAIEQSVEILKDDVKKFNTSIKETDVYCYPFGKFNDNMIQALIEEKIKMAFIYGPTKKEYRKASREDDNYIIPRLNTSHGMEVWKMALRLLLPF